jgi:non-canonical purine NTP pyrophosphatase (RdgB/HAM1 family)
VPIPPRLALATRNPGKIREILEICADWPVGWVTAADPGGEPWPNVEETGRTYLENAILKARAVAGALGLPALADDSGIEVDALDGAPGPRSARFAGPGAGEGENLDLLIERVSSVSPERRGALYRCVAVCVWPDGEEVSAEATCRGRLILEPRGTGGFGYDPAFVPEEHDGVTPRTMAELSAMEKNAISHRGRAFRALRQLLL